MLGGSIDKNGIALSKGTFYYKKSTQMIVCNGEELGGITS